MDTNLSINFKNYTGTLNNSPKIDHQEKFDNVKSRAAKIGLGILAAAIPLVCAGLYYHKYSLIQDDPLPGNLSKDTSSSSKNQKMTLFDAEISKGIPPKHVFSKMCLIEDEPGCLSFVQNHFPQMVKNTFATNAVYLLKQCAGKQTESCQSVIEQAFPQLIEFDIDEAIEHAETCLNRNKQICSDVVDKTYQALLIKDKSKALNFADYCFKNDLQPYMSMVEKSLPALLEGDELQALNCAINDTAECSVDVSASFSKLLNTSSLLASLFAKVCISKKEPVYQSVIDQAFPEILKKAPSHAVHFANRCLDDDEVCAQTIQKHLPLLFSDPLRIGLILDSKQLPCFGKETPVCKDLIKNSYFELKNNPLSFLTSGLFRDRVGKTDPDCQTIVLDMIEHESWIPWIKIVNKCMDKEDEVCQLVVQKAFDYYIKTNRITSLDSIAVGCIQKKSSACEYVEIFLRF